MTTVRVFGELADVIGRAEWRVEVATPVEAFQALNVNTRGKLLAYLSEKWSTEYAVLVNGRPLLRIEEFLAMQYDQLDTVELVPYLRGSGGDWWLVLVGVLLVALVVVAPHIGVGGLASTSLFAGGPTIGTLVFGIGLSMTFAGIASMLVPTPKADSERPENTPSYVFSGAINTYRQGNPIPVGFGLLITGSQVISAGVRSVDLL